jgi:hypothetical protein
MSIEKRRFIRFSLDIPAVRYRKNGEIVKSYIYQVSIGGCLVELDDTIFNGDKFRIEVELPNKNFLPLVCKAIYKSPGKGIGAKFIELSQFEQELLGQVIIYKLESEGLPLQVDPFAIPPTYVAANSSEEEHFINSSYDEGEMIENTLPLDN